MRKRVAFLTIGQTPRPELSGEIARLVHDPVAYDEYGVLDGLTPDEIAAHAPREGEYLVTRLRDGSTVVVSADFIVSRLQSLLATVDRQGYELIALLTTGVYSDFQTVTPLVHGQRVIDTWIDTLVCGETQIGVMFPLHQQTFGTYRSMHGAFVENARMAAYTGERDSMDAAGGLLDTADLILLHSVSYAEATARTLSASCGKPVVTARRVIAGAVRLRLAEAEGLSAGPVGALAGGDLIRRLPEPGASLTTREREVLELALEGHVNKVIARRLDISHRTVEVHRSRAISKYGANSTAEIIRRALMGHAP